MKTLSDIAAIGLHDQAFNHKLGSVTVFHGQVHTYKTARLSALKLLLVNHDPTQGKKEGATYKRASGDLLWVKGTWSDGTTTEKKWARKAGSVKFTGPEDPLVPVTMLDPERWFSQGTAQDRLNYVFGLVDLAALGYSTGSVLEELRTALLPASSDAARAWAAQFARAAQDFKTAVDNAGGSIQQWVEQLLVKLKADLKAAKETVQRAQGSAQLAVQVDRPGGPPPRDVTADLAAATKVSAEQAQRRSALGYQLGRHEENEKRIEALEAFVASFAKQVEERDKWTKRSLEAEAWLTTHEPNPQVAEECAAKVALVKELDRQLQAAAEQISLIAEELKEDLELKACPTCDSKGTGWKKSLKAKADAEMAEVQKLRLSLKKDLREARSDQDLALLALKAEEEEAKEAALKRAELKEARSELRALAPQLAAHGPAEAELATRKADRATFVLDFNAATHQVPLVDAELAATATTLAQLREEHDRWVARQALEKQLAEGRLALKAATDKAECIGAVLEKLTATQQTMVDAAMKSILAPANAFTAGFVPGEFSYFEGDFGYWYVTESKREWISHTVFSGAEQATAYAGLAVALCQRSPYKVVLLDRLDLDEEHKRVLFQRMLKLVKAGTIDQVFATDVSDACLQVEGLTVVEMAKRKAVEP